MKQVDSLTKKKEPWEQDVYVPLMVEKYIDFYESFYADEHYTGKALLDENHICTCPDFHWHTAKVEDCNVHGKKKDDR